MQKKMMPFLLTSLLIALNSGSSVWAGDCSLETGGEIVSLQYQYAVQLSDPNDMEEPVLSRLICTSAPFEDEQLWDWSRFRTDFHTAGHQGFYLQFQDGEVLVVGLAGHEENYSTAMFEDLKFEGEIGPERVVGKLRTEPAPTAFDETVTWTVAATVDLVPVPAW